MKAFIIFRDRVTYAHLCLTALTEAGLEPVIVDMIQPASRGDWLKALHAAKVKDPACTAVCYTRELEMGNVSATCARGPVRRHRLWMRSRLMTAR